MIPYTRASLGLTCALLFCTIQTPPRAPDTSPLNRVVALNHSKVTSGAAISTLLSEAHTPGGVISIYDDCSQPSVQDFSLNETTLKQGLDYISRIDAQRKWVYTNRIVIVGLELTGKTILNTLIHDVDIHPEEALSLTAQRLLSTPEVRESIQRAGLTELTPELGFAQIRKTPAVNLTQPPVGTTRHLHDIALMDALNVAAATQGTGVWEYEQFVCENKSSFRLEWVVK